MNKKFRKGIVLTPSDFNGVDWIEKMASAGLNTLGLHSGGGKAHDVVSNLGFTGTREFMNKISSAGLDYEYELHASANLLDRELFKTHPEYFPSNLRTGERGNAGNWCVSSSEALSLVSENAAGLAKKLPPSTNRYFFWGADSVSGDWCFCEECANLTQSDQNLVTVNAVAKRIAKDNPSAEAGCLTYLSTLAAPRIIKPEPNVFAEFAPIFRCYNHALCDTKCAVNRKHLRILLDVLEVFSSERIHILEYWLDSSLFGFPEIPHRSVFNRQIAERDIKFYASLGITSITTFAVQMNGRYMQEYGDREFLEYAEIMSGIS